MKILILALLSATLLFASSPEEVEKKVQHVVDMQTTHTDRIEKRIIQIENELEKKAKERAEKSELREARIQKLDDTLKQKAKLREESYCPENHSTKKEIAKELTTEPEVNSQKPDKTNS